MIRQRTVPPFAALALVSLVFLAAPAHSTTFVSETLAPTGYSISLAQDAFANPRISFFQVSRGLTYASRDEGVWTTETVAAVNVGANTSLRLDAQGSPHIAYGNEDDLSLYYASKSGGAWTLERVDFNNWAGRYSSMRLDGQGNPRVSYSKGAQLHYAFKTGSTWTLETVESGTGFYGDWNSLALDAQGNPHISYNSQDNNGHIYLRYASRSSNGVWTLETADGAGTSGLYTSLALDAQGNPHVSYYDNTNQDLKYAHKSGGAWSVETVVSAGDVGVGSSIYIDGGGNPHIAFMDAGAGTIRHAYKVSGVWQFETVGAAGPWFSPPSAVMSPGGAPRVAYMDPGPDLRYSDGAFEVSAPASGVHWPAGSHQVVRWAGIGPVDVQVSAYDALGAPYTTVASGVTSNDPVITVPAMATIGARLRIVRSSPSATAYQTGAMTVVPQPDRAWAISTLDARGGDDGLNTTMSLFTPEGPRVAYYDGLQMSAKFAIHVPGGWSIEAASNTFESGQELSMALDPSGTPSMAFYDQYRNQLIYAERLSTGWTNSTVATTGVRHTSICVPYPETPLICFQEPSSGWLEFASKNYLNQWVVQVVDYASSDLGRYNSMVSDPAGNVTIAYYDGVNHDLKLAKRVGSSWTTQVVDAAGDVGSYCALTLDMGGRPYIAYYDATNGRLKYAYNNGSTWTIETADAGPGFVGQNCSIAVDNNNQARVSYTGNGVLHYAERLGTTWHTTVVDTSGTTSSSTSIGVDPCFAYPRISYHDDGAGSVRFALTPVDVTPPGTVGDLTAQQAKSTAVVTWTAPGGDGSSGQACVYDVRYSTGDITEANFFSLPRMNSGFAQPAGQMQCADVAGLSQCTLYHYALKAVDAAYNWSALSNVANGYVCRSRIDIFCDSYALQPPREEPDASSLPKVPEYGAPHPNPAASTVGLRLGIPESRAGQTFTVGVYDVLGRRVRQLSTGSARPGVVQLEWDLQGESGGRVAAGIYFVRYQLGTEGRTFPFTVIH